MKKDSFTRSPKSQLPQQSPIFHLLCKANGLTTGTKLSCRPDSLCQAGSLRNCLHQPWLVCKQEERVQATATRHGMRGVSERHARDRFLPPGQSARARACQGDDGWRQTPGLSWHGRSGPGEKVGGALVCIPFLFTQQTPPRGANVNRLMVVRRLGRPTDAGVLMPLWKSKELPC